MFAGVIPNSIQMTRLAILAMTTQGLGSANGKASKGFYLKQWEFMTREYSVKMLRQKTLCRKLFHKLRYST